MIFQRERTAEDDVRLLSEMVFGTVAMTYRGSSFKVRFRGIHRSLNLQRTIQFSIHTYALLLDPFDEFTTLYHVHKSLPRYRAHHAQAEVGSRPFLVSQLAIPLRHIQLITRLCSSERASDEGLGRSWNLDSNSSIRTPCK